ncbi:hypothetical protein Acr_00g0101480 [Actinidia rufa]|uniref:Uncharacterized protein n=1 Tax=Actinidia rufa TaxID=165716 RepID=A0A7J0E048_9ERIC|nr:hypothetical protein Acr_00g0101480 [Actinidia rufa]
MMKRLFSRDPGDSSPQPSLESRPPQPAVTGPARPIRPVYCDENGKFRMDPEAVARATARQGPNRPSLRLRPCSPRQELYTQSGSTLFPLLEVVNCSGIRFLF